MFDGQCGFCTRCVGWLRAIDRHGRIDVQPYQAPGVPASIGATAEQCQDAVQWRGPDGVRRSGAEAVNAVLSTVIGTGAPSAAVPGDLRRAGTRLPLGGRPPRALPRDDAALSDAPGGVRQHWS